MADSSSEVNTTRPPMAYSQRGYRKLQRKVAQNRAVANKYKRYRKKPKTKAALNKSAIMTLSRQVRSLQLDKLGSKQYQVQHTHLRSSVPTQRCSVVTPLAFCANNFYSNVSNQVRSLVYQGSVDASGVPQLAYAGTTAFTKQGYDTDIQDQYQFNEYANAMTNVSMIQYLPICAKYTFTFNGSIANGAAAQRFRVTFLKMKKTQIPTSAHSIALPYQLGAYWHLCDDVVQTRNYFSKTFHEVLYDKFITIKASPQDNGTTPQGSRAFRRQVVARIAFPNKMLKPNLSVNLASSTFETNIPNEDQIWCIISTNNASSFVAGPSIDIVRSLCWRDQHGTTQ